MLIDFHIHSNTSSDTEMTAKEIYEKAFEKGIQNICITNHHEPSEFKKGDYKQSLTEEKIEKFMSDVAQLKKDARTKLHIGVEMSYSEEDEEYIREFLTTHQFDYVLGSIHYVRGWMVADIRNKGKISVKEEKKIKEEYFRLIKKAIKSKLFDAMSHMDHVKRVITEPKFEETKKDWEEVAELLTKTGVGFEVNTSWSRVSPGGLYPDKKIVELLIANGVKIVTLGSDAHRINEIGNGLEDVQEMLKSFGLEKVYMFEKRKKVPLIL